MLEFEEVEASSNCFVDILPPEVLSDILNYVCVSDQLVCRAVSCQWRQAVEATTLHDTTRVSVSSDKLKESLEDVLKVFEGEGGQKNFRICDLALSCESKFWRSRGNTLTSLELVECQVGERELITILNFTSGLKHLKLVQCKEAFMSGGFLQNQDDVVSLSRSLAGLQTLVLDNNTYLSDVLLLRFISVTKSLRSLSVSGCNVMNHAGIYAKYYPETQNIEASPSVLTWRTVVKVVEILSKTLKHLGLSRNGGIDLRLLVPIQGLALESIDITNCTSVDERAFSEFVESQPRLRKVEMAGCRRILSGLSGASKIIFKSMEKVEELNLNDLSIPHFDTIGVVQNIKALHLNSLDTAGSKILAGFQQLNVSKLRKLQARKLGISPEHLCSIVSLGMPCLTHLDVSDAGDGVVTDEVVQAICQHLPGLQHLNLGGNPSVTDMGTLAMDPVQDLPFSDYMIRVNQIALGSKAEQDIATIGRRQMAVKELFSSVATTANDRLGGMPFSRLRKLQYLSLRGTSITSLTLMVALEAPDLRHLDLSECIGIDEVGLHDAAAKHPRLEKLELMRSPLSDSGLLYCLSCLPRLLHLDVRRCPSLTARSLSSIPHVAPQLTTLLLANCPGVTKEAARTLEAELQFLRPGLDTLGGEVGNEGEFLCMAPPPPPPPPSL